MIGRFSGRWKANTEHRKIAMHQSRAIAAAYSLLHMIPLAAAITLLSFQFAKAWVGYANDYSTALQFAAKFHELVMQASLVEVLLCLIRTGMVDSLVPLGALSGAIQATQLSYLWSLDFFSIFTSRALEGWRRVIFLVAVPTLITLISVVGPSSAVLMIPRPNSPRVLPSVLDHVNASRGALYPSYFNLADVPNTYVTGHFATISTEQMTATFQESRITGCTPRSMVAFSPKRAATIDGRMQLYIGTLMARSALTASCGTGRVIQPPELLYRRNLPKNVFARSKITSIVSQGITCFG